MQRKLKCILVDDDPAIHDIFREYLKNNEYAEITDFYEDPVDFLNSGKNPDLVFLDIILPRMDGFSLAFKIKPMPVILFTGNAERFRDIMNMVHSIDAFPKPIIKERLLESVKKAYTLLNLNRQTEEYAIFYTSEGKVNIQLSDILFVRTIKNSHRNLELFLKGGRKLILKDYSLEYMLQIVKLLVRCNRFEIVSIHAVDVIEPNTMVKLKCFGEDEKPINIELHSVFRKNFLSHFPSF